MSNKFEELLSKVNQKLKEKPLVYISRDSERALGLENHLENYFVASIEESYISESLKQDKTFVLEKVEQPKDKTTNTLIESEKFKNWIKDIAKEKEFYAQMFQFNKAAMLSLENLGAKILNNDPKISNNFEDKISQYRILKENNIPIPQGFLININDLDFSKAKEIGDKFVIQSQKSHTGIGTFIIENEDDFNSTKNLLNGSLVKVTKFIDGLTFTINGCVTKSGTQVAGLQYQITGIPELTPSKGTTVGNDFFVGNKLDQVIKEKIVNITKQIGEILSKNGYLGLFGIDLIVLDDDIFVIEINARQTANISLQTKLEIKAGVVPLALMHLATFLDIDFEINNELAELEGSQIFLRAFKDKTKINSQIRSGIYRLQSDNAARDFDKNGIKENVIFLDENQDMPLIFQYEGYNVLDIKEGGFVLLAQKKDTIRDQNEEILRMQFNNQIIFGKDPSPWILEAVRAFKQILNLESKI